MIVNKCIYAFDECSILKLCEIHIPPAYQIFFAKSILTERNHHKIKTAVQRLDFKDIKKWRFVPSENTQSNIIKVANKLLEGYNIQMLPKIFKAQIIEQLEEFSRDIPLTFDEIKKNDEITEIKEIFVTNERVLKREKNIPEDDDMKIISGYIKIGTEKEKFLITEDEHFWGSSDLIAENFRIIIIEEWRCDKVLA